MSIWYHSTNTIGCELVVDSESGGVHIRFEKVAIDTCIGNYCCIGCGFGDRCVVGLGGG